MSSIIESEVVPKWEDLAVVTMRSFISANDQMIELASVMLETFPSIQLFDDSREYIKSILVKGFREEEINIWNKDIPRKTYGNDDEYIEIRITKGKLNKRLNRFLLILKCKLFPEFSTPSKVFSEGLEEFSEIGPASTIEKENERLEMKNEEDEDDEENDVNCCLESKYDENNNNNSIRKSKRINKKISYTNESEEEEEDEYESESESESESEEEEEVDTDEKQMIITPLNNIYEPTNAVCVKFINELISRDIINGLKFVTLFRDKKLLVDYCKEKDIHIDSVNTYLDVKKMDNSHIFVTCPQKDELSDILSYCNTNNVRCLLFVRTYFYMDNKVMELLKDKHFKVFRSVSKCEFIDRKGDIADMSDVSVVFFDPSDNSQNTYEGYII